MRRYVVLDDASQRARQRPLRETGNSRLPHHAEQRVKQVPDTSEVDFRTEEHERFSVTMEHLAQAGVVDRLLDRLNFGPSGR